MLETTARRSVAIVAVFLIVTGIVFGTVNPAISKKNSSDKVYQPVGKGAEALGNKTSSNQTGPAPGLAVNDPGAEGQKKPVNK